MTKRIERILVATGTTLLSNQAGRKEWNVWLRAIRKVKLNDLKQHVKSKLKTNELQHVFERDYSPRGFIRVNRRG